MREGWEIKKISDVVIDFHQGLNTAGQKIKFVDKGYPIIQTRNLDNGRIDIKDKIKFMSTSDWELYRDKYKPRIGDVFLTNIGTIGKTAVVLKEEDYLIHWNIFIFKLNRKEITPFYLKYFLDSPSSFNYYFSSQKGGTVNFITKRMIANMAIPIPPIQEQKQIVAILDKAFTAIDQAKANIEKNIVNAKELFQSKLNEIFSQKGDGWEEKTLIEVNKFIDYRGKTPQKTDSGIKLITAKNVRMGYLRNKPEEFIAVEAYDDWMTRGIPKKGDVLFTTEAPLANVTLLNTSEKIALAQRIITLCPNREILSGEYLTFCLQSKVIQDKILEKGTGATVTGIKSRLLKEIIIPIPPTKTQADIVNVMSQMKNHSDEIINNLEKKLESLEELKKSILQKAFAGELTQKEVEV